MSTQRLSSNSDSGKQEQTPKLGIDLVPDDAATERSDPFKVASTEHSDLFEVAASERSNHFKIAASERSNGFGDEEPISPLNDEQTDDDKPRIEALREEVRTLVRTFKEEAEAYCRPIEAFVDEIIAAENHIMKIELKIKTHLLLKNIERSFQPGKPLAELWDLHVAAERLMFLPFHANQIVAAGGKGHDEDAGGNSGEDGQDKAEGLKGNVQTHDQGIEGD